MPKIRVENKKKISFKPLHYSIFLITLVFSFWGTYFLNDFNWSKLLEGDVIRDDILGVTAPNMLSFQGRLTNRSDTPITTPTNVTFKIYNAPAGGTELWTGSCTITPDQDGIFDTLLGGTCGSSIPTSIFSTYVDTYLGITVGTDSEMIPRQKIVSSAYALNADTLDGFDSSQTPGMNNVVVLDPTGNLTFGTTSPVISSSGNLILSPSGNVGINISNPASLLHVNEGNVLITGADKKLIVEQSRGSDTNFTSLWVGTTLALFQYPDDIKFGIQAASGQNDSGGSGYSLMSFGSTRNTMFGDMLASQSDPGHRVTIKGSTSSNGNGALSVLNSSDNSLLFVRNDGNVGIGTSTPSAALDVVGDIKASGTIRNVTVHGTVGTAAATAAKVVNIPNYTLTTGDLLSITFTLGNSVSAATLNVNSTGPNNIRLGNTNVTTTNMTLAAGSTVLMYFDGTYFQIMGSQRVSDSNTYDRTYWNNAITAGTAIYDYKLIMQAPDGKWYPLTLEEGTSTTKTVSTQPFTINSPILYYATTTNVAANGTFSNVYSEIPMANLRYTANSSSWTNQKPIYLKGTINSSGNFVLDNTTYDSFITQTLPTSADGFVYILLGQMYSTTAMRLFQYHPIYEYKAGRVQPYGAGSTTFAGLTDTPNSYFGNGGYLVRVNAGATGLEFVESSTFIDTNDYVDSVSFNSTNGVLTLGRTGILPDLTTNLDGRYLQSFTEADTLQTVTDRGATTTIASTFSTSIRTPLLIGNNSLGIRAGANSTTAIQLQNASGTSILNVDTTNSRVGIGTTSPVTKLHIADDGGILAQGIYESGWDGGSLGQGSRLMWIPSKSAFRAGYVFGTRWDTANIGDFSVAMGHSTTASGQASTAMGNQTSASGDSSTAMGLVTTASGNYSTAMGEETFAGGESSVAMGLAANTSGYASIAMGNQTSASGYSSTAMGYESTASGDASTAMGRNTTAQAYASTVIGRYNVISGNTTTWTTTDPIFVIGIGSDPSNRANAMTVLKNGNVGIGATNPQAMFTVGATSQFRVDSNGNLTRINNVPYSWPSSNTSGVLANNGSGTLTWSSLASLGVVTGSGTGGGTAGQVTWWNGTSMITGSNTLWWNDSSGRLGIGTTNPQASLDIAGATSTISNASGNITITPASNLIVSQGNVGIGVSSPTNKLQLAAATATTGGIGFGTDVILYRSAANILSLGTGDTLNLVSGALSIASTNVITSGRLVLANNGTAAAPSFSFASDPDNGMYRATTDALAFSTAGTERMRILANGNVGIGVSSPTNKLQLAAATTTTGGIGFGTDVILYRSAANILSLGTGDTLNLVSGALSIASTNVITSGRLVLGNNGTAAAPSFSFASDPDNGMYRATTDALAFSTAATERMRILANGNIKMGENLALGGVQPTTNVALRVGGNSAVIALIGSNNPAPASGANEIYSQGIEVGTGDGASKTVNNLAIKSWYGIGFWNTVAAGGRTDAATIWFDVRTGSAYAMGNWNANQGDLAEVMTKDANEILLPGDIVQISSQQSKNITIADESYSSKIIGVISTAPGFAMSSDNGDPTKGILSDEDNPEKAFVGLIGKIPVKVVLTNGNINQGAPVTASSLPGFGIRATKEGTIIGKALESTEEWNTQTCSSVSSINVIEWPADDGSNPTKPCFKLPDGTIVGKIMVFVNVSWYNPSVTYTSTITNDSSDEKLKNITGEYTRGLTELLMLNPILYSWNELSGMEMENTYAGFSAQNVQQAIPEAVGLDQRGYLSLNDRPILAATVNAIKEQQEMISTLNSSISTLSGTTLNSTSSIGENIRFNVESKTLQFTNDGEVWYEFAEKQSMMLLTSRVENLETKIANIDTTNSINTENILKVKLNNEGNIELLGGNILMEGNGTLSIKKLKMEEEYSIGSAKLTSNQLSITINTKGVTKDSKVFVNPTSDTYNKVLYVTDIKEGESFRVNINEAIDKDITFDWFIIDSKKSTEEVIEIIEDVKP